MNSDVAVVHRPEKNRFETCLEGHTAVVDYTLEQGRLTLTHTGVPRELEGRGVGSALARAALDHARAQGLTVVPECPFIAAYLRRHPEYRDLLPTGYTDRQP